MFEWVQTVRMETKETQDTTLTASAVPEHRHRQPSRRALTTRSLTAVNRLPEGSPERAAAFAAHMAEFAPRIGSVCPVHR